MAAIDSNNQRASSSNYGEAVDLSAPGVNITSSLLGGDWGSKSSTYAAASHIAGAAAMAKLVYPTAIPSEVETLLKYNCTGLGTSGWDKYFGYGILDMRNLMTNLPYIDVSRKDWYYDGAAYVYSRQIMTGKDSIHFLPTSNMERQDAILLLYRCAGSPSVTYRTIFQMLRVTIILKTLLCGHMVIIL